jgi:glycosyltransferase involved in cell wall biosynthesis
MKVLVVAEYYPRAADPVLGVWAHRQALAAREAGAEVRVLVLHRPLPSLAALRRRDWAAAGAAVRQPRHAELDGLAVDYLHYLSPPRPWSYDHWGAWAAPRLRSALAAVRRQFPFELVHAHYAVPAGDAVRRVAPGVPLLVSEHGGDVYGPQAGSPAVARTFAHAQRVLANSAGTADRCRRLGAQEVSVLHLGTDVPDKPATPPETPTLVTVGHLIARKRHADVIAALPALGARYAGMHYVVVGNGPEREALAAQARELGVADRVQFLGQLSHEQAVAVARRATLFVMPSVDEAFGVSYIEAMAAGVPAIGCRGEAGPEEIAASGRGMELVVPRSPADLSARIAGLLSEPDQLASLQADARETVAKHFTWSQCGKDTVRAYGEVLSEPPSPPG